MSMRMQQVEAERNKAVVRDYLLGLVNDGSLDAVDSYIGDEQSRQFVVETLTWLRSLFSDLHVRIEDQVAEGDRVATRVTFFGTHAPTEQLVSWQGIAIGRLADGKVVEMWHEADIWGMMQQIDAVPLAAVGEESDSE
jgi:predicted ester cyclase